MGTQARPRIQTGIRGASILLNNTRKQLFSTTVIKLKSKLGLFFSNASSQLT
jgi:hypothetical protein